MTLLKFLQDFLAEPAILMGLVALVGLIAMRKPWHQVLTGTLGPILGYLMLAAGAGVISNNLEPLAQMIEKGFHLKGVVPNNEAVTAVAQEVLGTETMLIMVIGLAFNILFARFSRYKYIFLTGHHSFFLACLLSAVLGTLGFKGIELVLIGGCFMGAWSAISPAIGQRYTLQVTGGDEIALGHFGSLGYYFAAWIGGLVGHKERSTESIQIPEQWGFLRNTTISTAIIMAVFYLVSALAAGPSFVASLSGGKSPLLFAFLSGLEFAVGVTIVYNGVRMILADLLPAFQGIDDSIIPNAVPAVDCAVLFPYAQTAVILGFISSFIGGIIGMLVLGSLGGILIVPGLVPHFFCGATAGIYGNATGGRRGALVGAFINGLLLAFIPALALPVLGDLGFANTTFGDLDFGLIGILLGQIGNQLGHPGIYALVVLTLLAIFLPNWWGHSKEIAMNNEFKENDE